jgi:hypothetical protein
MIFYKKDLIEFLKTHFTKYQTSFNKRDIYSYSEGFNKAIDLSIEHTDDQELIKKLFDEKREYIKTFKDIDQVSFNEGFNDALDICIEVIKNEMATA